MKGSRKKDDLTSQSVPVLSSTASTVSLDNLVRLKEGYLVKAPRAKGNDRVRKGWQERYFILIPGKLLYFKSKGDKKIKGEINLKECAVVDTDQQNIFKLTELEQKCFTYLRAPSADIKQDWIEKIQKAIAEMVVEERVGAISAGGFINAISPRGSVSVKRDVVAADAHAESFENNAKTNVLTDAAGSYEGDIVEGKKHGFGVLKSQGHKYEGEWQKDKMHGQGVFTHATGVRYEGQWLDGKQHGFGTLTFPSGALYVGSWENGYRHGRGVMLSMNGCKYDGEFVKGRQHGHGVLLWANGNKYEGEFSENKGHGFGKFEYADGVVYEGEFVNGKFHGRGKLKFNKAREYEGMFVEDAYSGPGTLRFANGDVFDGFCKRHCREGLGSMHWSNGNEYEGEWKDDQMHGNGKFSSPDGHVYEGEFKENARHGKGSMIFPDQRKYEGTWINGQMNGQGSMYYPNGNIFVGNWVNGQKEGAGSFVWNDGRKFNGQYLNGKPNGHGSFMNAQGERYEGNYVDGKKHGKGQYNFADGAVYDGEWEDNFMHGQGTMSYMDGTRYEGEWTRDVRGEKGKFFWPNGDVFDGVFAPDGEFVGGVIQYGNGNRYEGEVLNGKRNGVGVMFWVIGERFDGHWKNGKRHGFGIMYLLDGRVTEGQYEDDRCVNLTIREKKEEEQDRPSSFLPLDPATISRQSIVAFREASKSILKPVENEVSSSPPDPMSLENPLTPLEVVVDAPAIPKCAADVDMDLEKNINFDNIDQKGLAEDLLTSGTDDKLEIGRSSVPKTLNLANDRAKSKNLRAKGHKKGFNNTSDSSASVKTGNSEDKNDSGDESSGTEDDEEKRSPASFDGTTGRIGRNASLDHLDTLTDDMNFGRESTSGEVIREFVHTAPANLVQETMIRASFAPKRSGFTPIDEEGTPKPFEQTNDFKLGFDDTTAKPQTEVPVELKPAENVLPLDAKAQEPSALPEKQGTAEETPLKVNNPPEIPPVSVSPAEVKETISNATPETPKPEPARTEPVVANKTESKPAEPVKPEEGVSVPAEDIIPPESKEPHPQKVPVPTHKEPSKPGVQEISRVTTTDKNPKARITETVRTGDLEYVRITDWNVDQVCQWLESNNFKNFVPIFREKNWDGHFVDTLELNSFTEFGSRLSLIQKRNLVFTVEQLRSRQKARGSHLASFSSASSEDEKDVASPSGTVVNVSKLRLFWERNATLDLK